MREIDSDKARQGRWGTQVLLVLLCGLILASAGWFLAENYGEAIESPATADGPGGSIGREAESRPDRADSLGGLIDRSTDQSQQ